MIGQDSSKWTVQVALSTFLTAQTINLHELFLAAAVSIAPLVLVFVRPPALPRAGCRGNRHQGLTRAPRLPALRAGTACERGIRMAAEMALRISKAVAHCKPVNGIRIVGVDGRSGSGKSFLASRLSTLLSAPVIEIDDFVSWDCFAGWWTRFDEQVLTPLLAGREARYQARDWSDWYGSSLGEWKTQAWSPTVILEGVTCTRRETVGRLAYAVWVEASPTYGLLEGWPGIPTFRGRRNSGNSGCEMRMNSSRRTTPGTGRMSSWIRRRAIDDGRKETPRRTCGHSDHAQRGVGGRLHRRRERRRRATPRVVLQRGHPDHRRRRPAVRSFRSWKRLQGLTCIGGVRPADVGGDRHDRDGPQPVRPGERLGGSAARGRPRGRGVPPAQARGLAPRGVVPFRR